MNIQTVRGTNEGAVQKYITDTATRLELGTTHKIAAMQAFDLEFDVDEGELYGDEAKLDVYALMQGARGTCKHGQVDLETLALMIGSTLEELGVTPNQTSKVTIQPTNPPYLRLRQYSAYKGANGGATTVTFVKAKITSLTIKLVAKGYAEIEFAFSGKAAVFPNPTPTYVEIESRETGVAPGDENVYMPHRQQLPLWAPDDSTGFTGRTTSASIIQQRAYKSSTEGDFIEWTRSLGAGTNTLTFFGTAGSGSGTVEVLLGGVLVGSVDLYAASTTNNYKAQVSLSVATSGPTAIRLRIGTKNASSTGDLVELSSVEVTHQGSAPIIVANTLPLPAQAVYQVSAFQYSLSYDAPTIVTPGTNAGEKLEIDGLAKYLEFEVLVEAGTYSIEALVGKASDAGSVTFAVEGATLGVVDTYNASTVTPEPVTVPGTFVVKRRGSVRVRITVTSKNASSTGYKFMLAWFSLTRTVNGTGLEVGDAVPNPLEFLPWHAEASTGWASSAETALRNWKTVSDGTADRILEWKKTFLGKGTWRARLAAKVESSGATLELHHGGSKVAEFVLDGSAETNGRIEAVFTLGAHKLSDLQLKNPSTTVATLYYLALEYLEESKSLGTIFLTGAAQHHIPDHRSGDAWPGLSYAFAFNGVPADFTGATAKWTVYSGSLSGPTMLQKTELDGLTLAGDTLTVDAFTPALSPGTYHYDLQITFSGGSPTTYVHGTWTII